MPENNKIHVAGNAGENIIVSGDSNLVVNIQNQNSHAVTPSFFDSTQEDKIADLCEFYLERPEILAEIDKHLNLNARCLLICGEPGIGKSALSAS
jgi:predicted PilT family ATPase